MMQFDKYNLIIAFESISQKASFTKHRTELQKSVVQIFYFCRKIVFQHSILLNFRVKVNITIHQRLYLLFVDYWHSFSEYAIIMSLEVDENG